MIRKKVSLSVFLFRKFSVCGKHFSQTEKRCFYIVFFENLENLWRDLFCRTVIKCKIAYLSVAAALCLARYFKQVVLLGRGRNIIFTCLFLLLSRVLLSVGVACLFVITAADNLV